MLDKCFSTVPGQCMCDAYSRLNEIRMTCKSYVKETLFFVIR